MVFSQIFPPFAISWNMVHTTTRVFHFITKMRWRSFQQTKRYFFFLLRSGLQVKYKRSIFMNSFTYNYDSDNLQCELFFGDSFEFWFFAVLLKAWLKNSGLNDGMWKNLKNHTEHIHESWNVSFCLRYSLCLSSEFRMHLIVWSSFCSSFLCKFFPSLFVCCLFLFYFYSVLK